MSSQYTKQKRVMEDPGDLPVEKKIIRDDDAGVQDRGGKDDIPGREDRSRPPTSTTPKATASQQKNSSNYRRARQQELLLQTHMNEYDEQSEEGDDDDVDLDMVPGAHRVGGTGESALYESMHTHGTNNNNNAVPPAPPPTTTTVVAHLATDIEELEGQNRRLAQQLADIANAEVVDVETKAAGRSLLLCSNLTKKTLMMIVALAFILIGLIFAIALGVAFRLNESNDSTGGGGEQVQLTTVTTTTLPTPHPTTPPTRSPTLLPTLPTPVPSYSPTSSPVASYLKSVVAPPGGSNFDHFEEYGLTINDESNIVKIRQIQVYAIAFCTNNDCSLPTHTQICLATTYLLNDCTDSIQRNGAYTDSDSNRAGIINLRRDQYVSRIEVFAKTYVTHIKICLTDGSCFGPYGSSRDVEPNYIFEEPHSVIKALHGSSGSWLDKIGVIFEQNFSPEPLCLSAVSVFLMPTPTNTYSPCIFAHCTLH